jgi:hypothetical protein
MWMLAGYPIGIEYSNRGRAGLPDDVPLNESEIFNPEVLSGKVSVSLLRDTDVKMVAEIIEQRSGKPSPVPSAPTITVQ